MMWHGIFNAKRAAPLRYGAARVQYVIYDISLNC